MKKIISPVKKWWDDNFQGFTVGWPPSLNFGKNKKTKYDPAKIDKILKIYESIKEYLGTIQVFSSPDQNVRDRLLKGTKYAEVIFPDNIIKEYVDVLCRKGLDLYFLEKEIHRNYSQQKREETIKKNGELFQWFCKQQAIVDQMFKPYLNK